LYFSAKYTADIGSLFPCIRPGPLDAAIWVRSATRKFKVVPTWL
jgi:hypothetical protein